MEWEAGVGVSLKVRGEFGALGGGWGSTRGGGVGSGGRLVGGVGGGDGGVEGQG